MYSVGLSLVRAFELVSQIWRKLGSLEAAKRFVHMHGDKTATVFCSCQTVWPFRI